MAAGVLGALLAVTFLARQEITVGPARVRLEAQPALVGTSRLAAPPFGSVSARTHQGPLTFKATIDDIDIKALGRLLARSVGPGEGEPAAPMAEEGRGASRFAELEATLGPLEAQARRAATGFLARIAVLGVAGGLAGVLLFPRRTRRRLLRCGLGGLAATVLLLGPALATYDLGAFREPRYDGALEYAPASSATSAPAWTGCAPCARRWSGSAATSTAPTPPWPTRSASWTAPAPCGSCTSPTCTSTRPGSTWPCG